MVRALALALVGCGGGPTLELDGPLEVKVERLGPVHGRPTATLSDGGAPEGVAWSVEPASVARVEGQEVVAQAEGEAVVTGSWQGQSVSWHLAVSPSYELLFVGVPSEVGVGEEVALVVSARHGGQAARPTALTWVSSDPAILAVSESGATRGVAPGVAFVTVEGHGSTAMAEIRVR